MCANSGPLKGALIIITRAFRARLVTARLESLAIFIGPLGPLAQGVRIPCIVIAFSSLTLSHLKVASKVNVKPGPLRGPYAINLIFAV